MNKKLSKKEQKLIKKYPFLKAFTQMYITDYRLVNGTPVYNSIFHEFTPRKALSVDGSYLDVNVDHDTIEINEDNELTFVGDIPTPVIKEITAHQTINTYEVPTLTTDDVTSLYNSVVAGRTTIIHFNPSGLDITTDYTITQASNVSGVAIRFVYNDVMILTYTISGDNVVISYKSLEQSHLYRHLLSYRGTYTWSDFTCTGSVYTIFYNHSKTAITKATIRKMDGIFPYIIRVQIIDSTIPQVEDGYYFHQQLSGSRQQNNIFSFILHNDTDYTQLKTLSLQLDADDTSIYDIVEEMPE